MTNRHSLPITKLLEDTTYLSVWLAPEGLEIIEGLVDGSPSVTLAGVTWKTAHGAKVGNITMSHVLKYGSTRLGVDGEHR